mmetsp:Transcript_5935/g.6924  ORF Transcript_5935/g.6924 Transcript_5935/m.6924 type:complete len:81 (+) Transcript_5935:39-281(+)
MKSKSSQEMAQINNFKDEHSTSDSNGEVNKKTTEIKINTFKMTKAMEINRRRVKKSMKRLDKFDFSSFVEKNKCRKRRSK